MTARSPEGDIGVDTFTITVTQRPGGLNLTSPIQQQLQSNNKSITSVYPYPADSPYAPGVRIPPNWSFSIGLQTWTFTTPSGSKVFYSASLADGSPLPDWLTFNNSTVTFDGLTPKVNKTTVFQVVLGASDVLGFQDKTDGFNITVSPHDFSAAANSSSLNITADGTVVDIQINLIPLKGLCLDGKPISEKDLPASNILLDTTVLSWLKYEPSNSTLSGPPPKDLVGQKFSLPVDLVDRYGDVLNTTLDIAFLPSAFTSPQLPSVVLVPGVDAKIPLDQYFSDGDRLLNVTASFSPPSASAYLTLSPDNVIHGTVPQDFNVDAVIVNLRAVDPVRNAVSTGTLPLSFAAPKTNLTTTPQAYGLSKGAIIAMAAVGAIVGCLLLLGLLLFAYRRCCLGRSRDRAASGSKLEDCESRGPSEDKVDGQWIEHEYKAETPVLEYSEKFGGAGYEPPSAKSLVNRSEGGVDNDLVAMAVPNLSGGTSSDRTASNKGTGSRPFLVNPFAKKALRPRPKISNPIVMPSFSNAAFQAQLAAAVNSAGIVKRGATFNSGISHGQTGDGSMMSTNSEFTDSAMLDHSILSSGIETEMDMDTELEGHGIGSEENFDRSITVTDDSQFNAHSSRASWESEPPFSWTQPVSPKASTEGYGTTSEDSHQEGTVESANASEPVQRSEFRPVPVPDLANSHGDSESNHRAAVDHRVVTPEYGIGSDEGISIDNIHFPTDSDIALTEASSDHEVSAVITTASRIDARRTLDSPASTSSPASSHTEKASSYIYANYPRTSGGSASGSASGKTKSGGGGVSIAGTMSGVPSPVMTTHSRLVSFGKQKTVTVTNPGTPSQDGGKRTTSQTAVVVNSRSASTNASSSGIGSVAMGMAMDSQGSSAYGYDQAETPANESRTRPRASSQSRNRDRSQSQSQARSQSRSPSPPLSFISEDSATPPARPQIQAKAPIAHIANAGMDTTSAPSPPVSLPSLPALPSITNLPPRQAHTQMVQRILLGVAEPFHFYPPLTLTPSPSIASTSTNTTGTDVSKPSSKPGASYHAYIEKKVLQSDKGKGKQKERDLEQGEGGGGMDKLPQWLRFEDMELWGVPAEGDRGVWSVRVVERLGGEERIVGRFALEVSCAKNVSEGELADGVRLSGDHEKRVVHS